MSSKINLVISTKLKMYISNLVDITKLPCCDSFVREETHRELRNTTTFVFQDGRLTTSTWFGVHVTKASLPVYTTLVTLTNAAPQFLRNFHP